MKIYVACLESYNNGILHGKWVDIMKPITIIHEEIQQMIHSGPTPTGEEGL